MTNRDKISFYVDTLLVEAILGEPKLYKRAGFVQDLFGKVKEYFSKHIDPQNPVATVLDTIAPGALWLLFNSLGIGRFGFLLGLLMDVFHVDVHGMLNAIYEKVKQMISGGKKVSSAEVDAATQSVIQEHVSTAATSEEAAQGYEAWQKKQQENAQADDGQVFSSLELMHDAKFIRLALIEYENQKMRLVKEAVPSGFLSGFSGNKAKGTSLLGGIIGWVIKLALASAGLMVAGDVVNEMVGRPSALSGTYQKGQEAPEQAVVSAPRSTQTKFPPKSDSPLPSSLPIVNNDQNIENWLIQTTKDVYSGLDGKENTIRNSPAFQAVKDNIVWYNVHNQGTAMTFLPSLFRTKKQLVDYYIDDVAKSAA